MPTTASWKDILDIPRWRPLANAITLSAAGVTIAGDCRNNDDRHPELFELGSAVILNKYNIKNNEWFQLTSPALAGTFGAGATAVVVPDRGPSGLLAAGCTTTSVILSTVLPASVGPNQLSNRGDGRGFKIRIINYATGKTEERIIVGNTGPSTTPTIYLDVALLNAPNANDRYEILSGRVYMLNAGAIAAGIFRYYDIATNLLVTCAQANLPATITTDSKLLSMSEQHVPFDRIPGEGFIVDAVAPNTYDSGNYIKNCLKATGIAAGSITGQAANGDATVLINEYRNFQIRIVQDTVNPTAVGQRRRITSHTVGPSPVYTLASNWTVNPSVNALYVIENWTQNILLWTTANTNTYNYSIDGDVWDTATWAVRPAASGAGVCAWQTFGLAYDSVNHITRHSYIYSIKGAAGNVIDLFDTAGAATGLWTGDIAYMNKSGATLFTTGTSEVYMGATQLGAYVYINVNGTQRFARFCNRCRVLESWANIEYTQGTAVVGGTMGAALFIDGNVKLGFLIKLRSSGAEVFECAITR